MSIVNIQVDLVPNNAFLIERAREFFGPSPASREMLLIPISSSLEAPSVCIHMHVKNGPGLAWPQVNAGTRVVSGGRCRRALLRTWRR